jgi:hypothetical protein
MVKSSKHRIPGKRLPVRVENLIHFKSVPIPTPVRKNPQRY